jgi:hypothetical protein
MTNFQYIQNVIFAFISCNKIEFSGSFYFYKRLLRYLFKDGIQNIQQLDAYHRKVINWIITDLRH